MVFEETEIRGLRMNMPPVTQILSTLLPYAIGAVGGIVGAFASGFLKEFFDERARRSRHKRDVARQVLIICNEASTENFRRAARNIEYVNSVMTDLDGVNEKMGAHMNSFINLWGRILDASQKKNQQEVEQKYFIEMLSEIEDKRKLLIAWANKIRVGK